MYNELNERLKINNKINIFMFLNVKSILIDILIINAICSAILVIISKNPVISVIFLISLVLNSALFLMVPSTTRSCLRMNFGQRTVNFVTKSTHSRIPFGSGKWPNA